MMLGGQVMLAHPTGPGEAAGVYRLTRQPGSCSRRWRSVIPSSYSRPQMKPRQRPEAPATPETRSHEHELRGRIPEALSAFGKVHSSHPYCYRFFALWAKNR